MSTVNVALTIGVALFGGYGAIEALRASYVGSSRAKTLTRRAALLGALTASLGLIACLVGIRLESTSEATIASLRGRVLSESQIAALASSLKSVPKPKVPVEIYAPPGVQEGIDIANSLKSAMVSAGFNVVGVIEDGPIGGTGGPGVLIRQSPKDDPIGAGIAAALKTIGLESHLSELSSPRPETTVEIFAGHPR